MSALAQRQQAMKIARRLAISGQPTGSASIFAEMISTKQITRAFNPLDDYFLRDELDTFV